MSYYRIVQIFKPLYETKEYDCVGIYSKVIEDAIKFRQMLRVISKNGQANFNPEWVKKNSKTMEKVFLRPEEPMKLYQLFIPKRKKKTSQEIKDEEIQMLFRKGIL